MRVLEYVRCVMTGKLSQVVLPDYGVTQTVNSVALENAECD